MPYKSKQISACVTQTLRNLGSIQVSQQGTKQLFAYFLMQFSFFLPFTSYVLYVFILFTKPFTSKENALNFLKYCV